MMAPAVQAPGVIGVPAVGSGKGKSGQPRTATPPPPPKSWRAREMQPHHKRRLSGAPFLSLGHRAPSP